MGCFDVMCSASNTPISSGDRIVMIYAAFVNPVETLAGMNFGGNWSAISLPVRGEYNDYGEMENIDSNQPLDTFFQTKIIPQFSEVCLPGRRSRGDNADIWDMFKEAVHSGIQPLPDEWHGNWRNRNKCVFEKEECSYSDRDHYVLKQGNGTFINKLFIHEAVYDKLTQIGSDYKSWRHDEVPDVYRLAREHFAEARAKAGQVLSEKAELETLCENTTDPDIQAQIRKLTRMAFGSFSDSMYESKASWKDPIAGFASFIDSSAGNGEREKFLHTDVTAALRLYIMELMGDDEEESNDLTNLIDGVVQFYYFAIGLNCVGRELLPAASVGEQHQSSSNCRDIIDFSETIIAIQSDKINKWDEDC
jgi:hypothetical protein